MWENIKFNCPKCGELIDFSMLNSNITSHLAEIKVNIENKFKSDLEKIIEKKYNSLLEEKIITEKTKLIHELELQKETDILNIEKKLNQNFSDEKTKLIEDLAKKDVSFQVLTAEKDKVITELTLKLESLTQNIETNKEIIELKAKENATKLLEQKTAEFINIIDDLKRQVNDLDKANAINKAINSKIKGNNFERYFHDALNKTILVVDDKVEKINRTGNKADFVHKIFYNNALIGNIIYELKDTEKWDDKWLPKFAEDILTENGDYGILVSNNVKEKYNLPFTQTDNPKVYVTEPDSFEFVMTMIRKLIIVEKTLSKNNQSDKLSNFMKWKEGNLQIFKTLFYKTMEDNEAREKTITNKLKEFDNSRILLIKAFEEKIIQEIDLFLEEK